MDKDKVGNFIKNLRKKYNLTQSDIADKYNVTYQSVSKWENGINLPSLSLLKQISKDYNIDITDILDGEFSSKKHNKNNLIFIIIIIFFLTLISFFINKQEIEVIRIGAMCLQVAAFEQIPIAFVTVFGSYFKGIGNPKIPFYVSFFTNWFLRIPIAFYIISII